MQWKNTDQRYGFVSQAFHWVMALMILVMLGVGLYMASLDKTDPNKYTLYGPHESVGVLVLTLVVARLAWRLRYGVPTLPSHMQPWMRRAAHLVHGGLYMLMVAMPLSGLLMALMGGHDVPVFGWFSLAAPAQKQEVLAGLAYTVHTTAWWGLIGLIVAHVGAALVHHFYWRDDVLQRMLPWRRQPL